LNETPPAFRFQEPERWSLNKKIGRFKRLTAFSSHLLIRHLKDAQSGDLPEFFEVHFQIYDLKGSEHEKGNDLPV
jgi:hypothetical protein